MDFFQVEKGNTSTTINVFIQKSTDGSAMTGLAYNTSGLKCYYKRTAGTALTELTLATLTATGSHNPGGFVELSATNAPGMYRLDLPNSMVATGANRVGLILSGVTDMQPLAVNVNLIDPRATAANLATANSNISTLLTNLATANTGITTIAGYLDTEIADILADTSTTLNDKLDLVKAVTDQFVFTVTGMVDANMQAINDIELSGDGESGTEFTIGS